MLTVSLLSALVKARAPVNKFLMFLAAWVLTLIGINELFHIYYQLSPRPQIVYQHNVCDEGK